jgi:hypothetical protein
MTASTLHRARRLPSRPAVITALQFAYLAWAAVELGHGRTGNALALVVVFAVLQVPRFLQLPVAFDVAFLVAWTLQELGQVAGFWSRFLWWDTLVHTALPSVLAPTAVIVLIRAGVLPDVLHPVRWVQRIGAVLLVFLVAASFGSAYEIYEWTSDSTRGTHYQPDNNDTMTDTTANAIGGLAGGVLLVASMGRRRRRVTAPAR